MPGTSRPLHFSSLPKTLPQRAHFALTKGTAEQEQHWATETPASPLPAQPRAPPPRSASPAASLEESECLGREAVLQRDNVECKYQLNMHYHMPAPLRSVSRQHEPGRCGSEELEAQRSALPPPASPAPSALAGAVVCVNEQPWTAPSLLPGEHSLLPTQHCALPRLRPLGWDWKPLQG